MTEAPDIVLCCLLWAREGETAGLTAYEDAVLEFLPHVGGEVVQRAVGTGADGHPHEVQLLRFPHQAAIDAFVADPRRVALAAQRERVVARTELFPVALP